MAVEVDELYSSLNKLLNDICKFLTDETNYHKLSPYARKQADELIGRSKKQLQEIAKISDENGAYVDMERKSDDNGEDDIYSSIEVPVVPQTVAPRPTNPYLDLPAKELCHEIKYGTLYWKCKIILNFEKNRRIFAGVHGNWFLMYSTEKDQKPMQAFYLKHYKTQAVPSKQTKNLPQDFELVCTDNSKEKSYYFVASTHKDMLQWTSRINQCYSILNNQIDHPGDNTSEPNVIPELKAPSIKEEEEEEEEDEIYHEIESYSPEQKPTISKPPDLPIRSVKTTISQRESSGSSSVSSTYDVVISPEEAKTASRESVASFSDDDLEEIYDELCCPQNQSQVNGVKLEEKQEEKKEEQPTKARGSVLERVKILEKPKPLVKPKLLPQKPKTFGMLRK